MIKNSILLRKLENKYAQSKLVDLPTILFQLKYGNLRQEIKYIESILENVDTKYSEKWIKDFISAKDGQHWGSWFEIRLYDWLCKFGMVEIEPSFLGDLPDFKIKLGGQDIFVEAKSFVKDPMERRTERLEGHLNKILSEVNHPVIIRIENYKIGSKEVDYTIVSELNEMLPDIINDEYLFKDKSDNEVKLTFSDNKSATKAFVIGPSSSKFINTDLLKTPLKYKSQQHSSLRNSANCYIIALFLESTDFGGQDIVTAWFGKPKVTFDRNTLEILSSENDLSGLHFGKSKIFHTTVSGTIIFKVSGFTKDKYRELETWFIQNPYAVNPIDTEKFPSDHKFAVLETKENTYKMGWYK